MTWLWALLLAIPAVPVIAIVQCELNGGEVTYQLGRLCITLTKIHK